MGKAGKAILAIDFKKKLDNLQWRKSLPPFWADDFDVDLLKVFPDIRDLVGQTLDIPIWTVSGTTFGRLNCPSQWNTQFGTFLWLEKPNLQRDANGWANINGYVTKHPEVEGTWLEWLRDAWAHTFSWRILPSGETFAAVDWNRCFYSFMGNIRGWENYSDATLARRAALIWLKKANRRFAKAVEAYRIGRVDYPYLQRADPRFEKVPRL